MCIQRHCGPKELWSDSCSCSASSLQQQLWCLLSLPVHKANHCLKRNRTKENKDKSMFYLKHFTKIVDLYTNLCVRIVALDKLVKSFLFYKEGDDEKWRDWWLRLHTVGFVVFLDDVISTPVRLCETEIKRLCNPKLSRKDSLNVPRYNVSKTRSSVM